MHYCFAYSAMLFPLYVTRSLVLSTFAYFSRENNKPHCKLACVNLMTPRRVSRAAVLFTALGRSLCAAIIVPYCLC